MKKYLIIVVAALCFNSLASESIGYYSNGSVLNSVSIDQYSGHFEKLFRGRKRLYATDHLLSFISEYVEQYIDQYPNTEKFQIGDISAVNGGQISRHASHQNGLDADLVYLRVNKAGQDINNPEWGEYFVKNSKLTKNFDIGKNWSLFKMIVSKGGVGRIFVDTAVKKKLCELYGSTMDSLEKETLRRLRPAKYHLTHYHLRLKCHPEHKRCQSQPDPVNSTGCGNLFIEQL